MVKISMSSTKYVIYGNFEVEGYIDKPDLIGSFFGQTEGLIGENLEFQNLQKTGKIGRIDINLDKKNGKTKGNFLIPTSLDKIEVSLVAAAIESIKKIGHTNGNIKIIKIKDEREKKRKILVKRAEELLLRLKEELPESIEIENNINENISKKQINKYFNKYYGGPNLNLFDEIILVEGRADVLNLLKNGFNNVLSLNGSSKLSKEIIEFLKNKKIILFLDDDNAGKKEFEVLKDKLEIDYFIFAPNGKEVEELSFKEIIKCLKNIKEINLYENNLENNNLALNYKNINNKNLNKKINFQIDKNLLINYIKENKFNIKDLNKIKKIINEEINKIELNKPKIQKITKKIIEKTNKNIERIDEKIKPEINNIKKNIINKSFEIIKNLKDNLNETEVKVEESNFFNKKQFEKIEYLIEKIKNKNNFILLNNDFRQIKVGNLNEIYELKTNKGKILILDGVCENLLLKKTKEIGIKLIICKSKSKINKNNKIKIKLFKDFEN